MWGSVAATGPRMSSEAALFWSKSLGVVLLVLVLVILGELVRRNFQRAYIPLKLMERQVMGVLLVTLLSVGVFGVALLQFGQWVLREELAREQARYGLPLGVRTQGGKNSRANQWGGDPAWSWGVAAGTGLNGSGFEEAQWPAAANALMGVDRNGRIATLRP